MKLFLRNLTLFLVFSAVSLPLLFAGSTTSTTYFSAPIGDYMNIVASEAFKIGRTGAIATSANFYGNNMLRVMQIKNNGIQGWSATSRGGNLRVEGNVNMLAASGTSVFFVDSANNRVGVGLLATAMRTIAGLALDVRGTMKAQVLAAHEDTTNPYDNSLPWAELQAQYNAVDNTTSAGNPLGSYARFSSVYHNGLTGLVFGTLHIDAQPLYLQSVDKSASGMTMGQGMGRVVIRGYNDPLMTAGGGTAANLIFIVGEPGSTGISIANNWNPPASSRVFKKDIAPLSADDYKNMLSKLAATDIVRYHFKQEAAEDRAHTGFIAEEAPSVFVGEDGKCISLQDELGFFLATRKALKLESDEIGKKVRELSHE